MRCEGRFTIVTRACVRPDFSVYVARRFIKFTEADGKSETSRSLFISVTN